MKNFDLTKSSYSSWRSSRLNSNSTGKVFRPFDKVLGFLEIRSGKMGWYFTKRTRINSWENDAICETEDVRNLLCCQKFTQGESLSIQILAQNLK